jgi:Protein of unknown function (DUF2934)
VASVNDDYLRRVRLRAYLIWEREGRPEGREVDHWLAAEGEIAKEEDAAGLRAGRSYDEGVRAFERSGRVQKAAEEAREALNTSEKNELDRAQEIGRRAGKGDDAGGKR